MEGAGASESGLENGLGQFLEKDRMRKTSYKAQGCVRSAEGMEWEGLDSKKPGGRIRISD